MCSVSAVSEYYTNTYPNRLNTQLPGVGGLAAAFNPPVVHTFDAETKEMMRQALKLLDRIDKRLGDVECMDDMKKEFLKALDLDPAAIGG